MATSPAKRQLQDEDRDESEQGSSRAPTPVPKRVKREPSLARRASRGVSRAAGEPSATSDHDSESELDNSEYESELEAPTDDEEHFDDDEANVKAYEEAKAKTGDIFGWASDAGIIKQVILVDFMCHRHFSVELGNRMNFIVGHNGSGKSAVLTGIAVALGGKAAVTGRGQGLKDLIRRDADKAVVTVIMSNEGPEAFKPELYGSQIVIERTLHKNGGSSYRFRATRDGKIIAQKRDELNEICANFSITIDSPLTILTQDAARSFLQNATDEMLYKFFLEGTGLDSLSAYYQKMQLQGEQLKNIADSQAEKIPLKEIEVDQLHRQVAASRRIVELQAKITRLTSELAWAYIRDKETELEDTVKKLGEIKQKVDAFADKAKQAEDEFKSLEAQVKDAEDELKAFRATKLPLEQKKESAKTKLGQAQTILRQANTDITKTERTIAAEKKSIAQLEQEIAKKQAELNQAETDAQRDARLSLKRHQDLLKRLQEDAPRKLKALETLQAQGQVIDREVDDLVVKKGSVEQNIRNIEDRIKRLREQSGDRLNLFGTGLDRVRQAIDHPRQPWKGGKPIGPLGMYVNLEDPMYRKVACSVLGTTLCGFAVKHPDDKVQLLSILQNVREYKPGSGSNTKSIITYSGDRFDYSRGSLNHLAPTLLSKLRIEDEDVLRILVNQHRIERLFVAPSVKVANEKTDEMMARGLPGAEFVTADCYRTTANQGKGKGSTPLEDWRGSPLFSKNMAVEIADLEQKRGAEVASVEQYDRDFKDAKARQNAKRTEIADMQKEHSRARVGIQSAEKTIHRLESQIEERPDDAIGGLEMARQEHERVLKAREDDLKSFQADLPGYEETIQKLSNEFEDLGRQIAEFIPETQKRQDAVNIVKEAQTKARNEMRQHRESHANFRTRLQEREDDRDRAAAELKDWEVQAQRIEGDRVNSRRTIEQIKKEKEATEKARIEAEKRQGVSLEEIMPRYQKAKDELAELKRQLANFRSVANQVKQMFRTRMRWWELQRNSIAIRARTLFIVNLHKRNLEGKLLFEHKKKKLGVRIQTTGITKKRDAGGAEEARFKVPKNLSGGERSFSTVSLLLSLWDTASCPIRCLDEWDVFLDAGNRGVAAKMLVEGAKESQGKQFILITPLDLHGVKCDGPGNKQIRLDDPVRNQATLSFAPQTAD